MTRFLLGFGLGIASMVGLLIIEEYLENASLRDEPEPIRMTFGEMAATT